MCTDSSGMKAEEVVTALELLPHPEGGFFKETYRSGTAPGASRGLTDADGDLMPTAREPSERNVCTSIYYMLTREAPIGFWHMNQSSVIHYWQSGAALTYLLIDPSKKPARIEKHILGPNITGGEVLQLIVPGGYWKATVLTEGDWGLLGEAVAPGFDYRDMCFGTEEAMRPTFPELWDQVVPYIKKQ